MKKIAFICPYIGKLPEEQMKLFLKSCKKNPNVVWIIMTDDKTNYDYPNNVKLIYVSLDMIRKMIQKKFDFKISLNYPYKLCDFRPAYGFVFQDLIKEYDYWGHCDLSDSLFGNFEKTISSILDKGFDKIGLFGHLTLYKNTQEINERFFLCSNSRKNIRNIFGKIENMAFDDTGEYNMNSLYLDNNFKIKRIDELYVDVSTRSSCFRISSWSDRLEWLGLLKEKYIIEWNNGRLYKIYIDNNIIKKEEILYVHYQKRKMSYEIDIENTDHFYIVPNKFIKIDKLDKRIIKKYTRRRINWTLLNIRRKKLVKIIKTKLIKK